MAVCCTIQLAASTVVCISEMAAKYCLNHVGFGLCIAVITAGWRGRNVA